MAVDTLTEGSDRNTARRVARHVVAGATVGTTIAYDLGVLAPTTGGGSNGLGCGDTDGMDALEYRNRGNSATEQRASGGSFRHWYPA